MMKKVCLVVSSCDRYFACWRPFFYGLKKYWSEHPRVYVITNTRTPPMGTPIYVHPDLGWSENLLYALKQVPYDIVIYSQEDYWLSQRVVSANIEDYVAYIDRGLVDYIRLYPAPPPNEILSFDERLGIISLDAEYVNSLQLAIWRKDVLMSLIEPGESPWEFETNGPLRVRARRSRFEGRFWCVTKRRFGVSYVFTAVEHGKWTPQAFQYVAIEGINVEFGQLPRMGFSDAIRKRLYRVKKKVISWLKQLQQ